MPLALVMDPTATTAPATAPGGGDGGVALLINHNQHQKERCRNTYSREERKGERCAKVSALNEDRSM